MTLSDLIAHHNGEMLLYYRGRDYDVYDVEFATRPDGMHFAYAVGQQGVWNEVQSIQHIADSKDGKTLYSLYVSA
jgi:hypothetical protein